MSMTNSGSHPPRDIANDETAPQQTPDTDRIGLLAVLSSVFAAALGVQSSKNRERDFKQGSAGIYIAAGLVFTLLFIATVVMIVKWVIATH